MATKARRPDSRTHVTHAMLTLREQILNGEFRAGERMSELPLVERLGVSRTPVRLALAELEHEGLLSRLPGGGYAVKEFTLREIEEAVELRGVLEGTAARFAAERGITRRELRALEEPNIAIGERLQGHIDYDAFVDYVELNERFHEQLIEVGQSSLLKRTISSIKALPFAGASTFVLAESELQESHHTLSFGHREHTALIEAIVKRQGARAEALAREHARRALHNLAFFCSESEHFAQIPGSSLISRTPVPTPPRSAHAPVAQSPAATAAGWSQAIAKRAAAYTASSPTR